MTPTSGAGKLQKQDFYGNFNLNIFVIYVVLINILLEDIIRETYKTDVSELSIFPISPHGTGVITRI